MIALHDGSETAVGSTRPTAPHHPGRPCRGGPMTDAAPDGAAYLALLAVADAVASACIRRVRGGAAEKARGGRRCRGKLPMAPALMDRTNILKT